MPKYPKRQIGQFTGPGWRVAPPSAGGSVSGAGKQQADRMQAFSAFSQSLAGALVPIGKERTKEDIKKAQQFVVENEGVWRDLERSGELDWTPPMMRAAWNMDGELAGQEFIGAYDAAMGTLSMEEASDIETPKRVYDDMMDHHLSTDKRRNTEFDDGFSKYAINVGRQHVSAYTVAAAKNKKEQGIFTLGLITKNAVLDGLSLLDGLDPSRPEYEAMAEQAKNKILYDLTLIANGTHKETESGTIDTGAYGSGFWTADRGAGAATFLNSILEVAQQGVVDPQILLDVVEEISVGPHKLAGIETMQVALSEYKSEGGDFDQATSKWKARVTEGRHAAISAYEVLKHSAALMAADGEVAALAQTLPKLYGAIPNLYFGEEMWEEYTALGKMELNVLEYEDDRIRIAQEKELVDTAEKVIRGKQTALLRKDALARFERLSAAADPFLLADSDSREAFITAQQEALPGWSRKEISTVMEEGAFNHIRGLAEKLNSGTAVMNGVKLETREQQVLYYSNVMANFAYNNNNKVPELATLYRNLYDEFVRTSVPRMVEGAEGPVAIDPDAFLASPRGLALVSIVTAGAALQYQGQLGTAMGTGEGAGNHYQALSYPVGNNPDYRKVEDTLISDLKERGSGRYTEPEFQAEFRILSASGRQLGEKEVLFGAGRYGFAGGYGDIKKALVKQLPEEMSDVTIHEWTMEQMLEDVMIEARRLYSTREYENNMEAAINKSLATLGPSFTGITTSNDNGFFAHNAAKHPWLYEIDGKESFHKRGKLDSDLLSGFVDYMHGRIFYSEEEYEAAEREAEWNIHYGADPAQVVRERDTSILFGEGEPRLVSDEVESLLIQSQFKGRGVVFYGDTEGRIWYGAGGDDNIANKGSMINNQIEGMAKDFLSLRREEKLKEQRGGISMDTYNALKDERDEIRAEDKKRNLKRSSTMYGDKGIHGYLRDESWPSIVSGDMPSILSEDPKDQAFIEEILNEEEFNIALNIETGETRFFRRGHGDPVRSRRVEEGPYPQNMITYIQDEVLLRSSSPMTGVTGSEEAWDQWVLKVKTLGATEGAWDQVRLSERFPWDPRSPFVKQKKKIMREKGWTEEEFERNRWIAEITGEE